MGEKIERPNCPDCLSDHVAWILWGRPSFDQEHRLDTRLERKEYVLGGCMIPKQAPEWRCMDCGRDFGFSAIGLYFYTRIKQQESQELLAAQSTFFNEAVIKGSTICGCFSCGSIFPADTVNHWVTDIGSGKSATALCPACTMDTVIGDASGFPVTGVFLRSIHTMLESIKK